MRMVTLAATQMACTWDHAANIAQAEVLVRKAAAQGAQIILLPELFETPYFCQDRLGEFLDLARPITENPAVRHFQALARELGVVLPISVFERAGQNFFNTVAVVMPTAHCWARTANRISRIHRAIRKSSIFRRATPVFAYGVPRMLPSAWASAGISGFPRLTARWR